MEAPEASADRSKIHPSPPRCPRVSCQRRVSVPFMFLGFTTTPPRPGREIPVRLAGGATPFFSAIFRASNLRAVDRPVSFARCQQFRVRAKALQRAVVQT